ncbi:MAG: crossover junction endodeoxyribonuclease RuvC [Pseudomonadota bacterium]|nr:crossover junction endodeoxyribonuclease RuvC [Pseudomonadota bacterium]MDE3037961.1 crossover junction endodeoxyribonuclease RuvC [Pseudomonadota bacterium]
MTLILGIDPGLQRTGWGVIASKSNQLSFIDCGVIATDADAGMAERLKQLHDGIAAAIAKHHPQEAAVEETFINKSGSSSLKLGQARGAILLSLSLSGLTVYEYGANKVKKSVVGSGHADKNQVGMMVKILLPSSTARQADAADALAVAIAHAHYRATPRQA